jgi:hypothetical protein
MLPRAIRPRGHALNLRFCHLVLLLLAVASAEQSTIVLSGWGVSE